MVIFASQELRLYISKLKLSTYQLQEKIEMIDEIISIYENGYIMTSKCLVHYPQSIPTEISHIIYLYVCDDFLTQAPFLRILLCDRIKKFYKVLFCVVFYIYSFFCSYPCLSMILFVYMRL